MKIKQILEARYAIQKPNTRDVHLIAQRYKRFTNNHISDQELWDEGKPSIDQKGTISQGFTSLDFTFQNTSAKEAEQWVRSFVGTFSLPYTELWTMEPRGIGHLIAGNENQYTRVTIKYEEHGINEAKYTSGEPLTAERISKIYKRYDNSREVWQRLGLKEKGTLWITMSEPGTTPVLHFETRGLSERDARKIVKRFLVKNNVPYNYVHSTITHVSPAGAPYVIVVVTYDQDMV